MNTKTISIGATFVHAHVVNEESRKYFTRAFLSSGSLSFWNLFIPDSNKKIQKCLGINEMSKDKLLKYLKTANMTILTKCNGDNWPLTVESSNAIRQFLTKRPGEIYVVYFIYMKNIKKYFTFTINERTVPDHICIQTFKKPK